MPGPDRASRRHLPSLRGQDGCFNCGQDQNRQIWSWPVQICSGEDRNRGFWSWTASPSTWRLRLEHGLGLFGARVPEFTGFVHNNRGFGARVLVSTDSGTVPHSGRQRQPLFVLRGCEQSIRYLHDITTLYFDNVKKNPASHSLTGNWT